MTDSSLSNERIDETTLADDILRGAAAIARYTGNTPRSIYYRAERGDIPVYREGSILCARKSRLLQHIEEQEARALGGAPVEKSVA